MEQIGDSHQFERQFCPVENISTVAFQSLDTVRALHQTVVSLRTALEEAHKEIDNLKKQIVITTDIEEGKKFHKEEHRQHKVSYRQPISEDVADNDESTDSKGVSNSSNDTINQNDNAEQNSDQQLIPLNTESENSDIAINDEQNNNSQEHLKSSEKKSNKKSSSKTSTLIGEHHIFDRVKTKFYFTPTEIQVTKQSKENKRHLTQMASKIDVKVKLTSNIKVDGSSSDTTTESNSDTNTPRDSSTDHSKDDDVNVNITSKDVIQVEKTKDGVNVVSSSKENINVENLSLTSVTTTDDEDTAKDEESDEDENEPTVSQKRIRTLKLDADSGSQLTLGEQSPQRSTCDNQEEVDDIELIFSSDDKEYPQEDLVSISCFEPWQTCGQSGTPILVNFAPISSDNETGSNRENKESDLLVSSIDADQFYNAIRENVAKQNSLESSDSLSVGDNVKRSYDFIAKSSNFEKGSDPKANDGVGRDDSFDTFEQPGYASAMGRRWTNYNVYMETDISKCGIIEENILEKGRRNTCPNPSIYRPILHREALTQSRLAPNTTEARCPLAVKFSRNARSQHHAHTGKSPRPILSEPPKNGPKRSSSAQTDISALPEYWRSESQLTAGLLGSGFFTLPSKFVPPPSSGYYKYPLKMSEKTREARRVLLSDINFTSMVPELSRSADHLCHNEDEQNHENNNTPPRTGGPNCSGYYKGTLLKTPDYANKGITPSANLTSPGISQWTVNENSFGTQTTQTDHYWAEHNDSFDSCKSYSIGSKNSTSFGKHNRSRSCPSVRCALCKYHHHGGIKMSESLNYTPRVTFQEPNQNTVRGSLPDLRPDCTCGCSRVRTNRNSTLRHGDSCGSTESLLDETEDYLRKSVDGILNQENESTSTAKQNANVNRRCSENDIKRDYSPSKQTLPFLPKSSKCLKPGHLAKVIAKNGRVVFGRVRYVGPLVSTSTSSTAVENETYVGLQLPNKLGDCDGSFEGRKFFDCEPQHGIFVPFKKIVMAWAS